VWNPAVLAPESVKLAYCTYTLYVTVNLALRQRLCCQYGYYCSIDYQKAHCKTRKQACARVHRVTMGFLMALRNTTRCLRTVSFTTATRRTISKGRTRCDSGPTKGMHDIFTPHFRLHRRFCVTVEPWRFHNNQNRHTHIEPSKTKHRLFPPKRQISLLRGRQLRGKSDHLHPSEHFPSSVY
jgi:hypothetical protein